MDNARQTGPAVGALFPFLLWLISAVETLPGDRNVLPGVHRIGRADRFALLTVGSHPLGGFPSVSPEITACRSIVGAA